MTELIKLNCRTFIVDEYSFKYVNPDYVICIEECSLLKDKLVKTAVHVKDSICYFVKETPEDIKNLINPTTHTQQKGCFCPPTSEQTCQGIMCPRKNNIIPY